MTPTVKIRVMCSLMPVANWYSNNKLLCMQLNLSNVSLKYFLRTSKVKVVCWEKDSNNFSFFFLITIHLLDLSIITKNMLIELS